MRLFIGSGLLVLSFVIFAPSSAAAFCSPADSGWQSYGTSIVPSGLTSATISTFAKVNHVFSHPTCQGVVASKVTLLGTGPSCTDTQGVQHINSTNDAEVRFSRLCVDLPCGLTFNAGGEHWWGYEPNDSVFSTPPNGYHRSCPSPQEECDETGGEWVCDNFCECDYINCPLLVDLRRDGVNLTDGPNGVDFDLRPDGELERLAWTSPNVRDDAFLVLDRNGNGRIDDGRELFSNYALRDRALPPNGFSALALYDHPDYGGNRDGKISSADAVFGMLELWTDLNHDGASQRRELAPLGAAVSEISLRYQESDKQDQFGNLFKYFSRTILQQQRFNTVMYDVFLVN